MVALDDQDRARLLRYDEHGGVWATPGGSLDEGEDHETAARRTRLAGGPSPGRTLRNAWTRTTSNGPHTSPHQH
ncbi:NUDIX hydrolase [Streptomyces triculaminicus]|uniref:NUDIX hydrolase n=1 Tax=Streptomyces triculaminicus TaxID=2816232 RepID=UPI0037D68DB8